MPTKFRKTVWVKRGDYLIVEPIEEGNKVKAEILSILNKDHIRHLKSQGVWPKEFASIDDNEQIPRDMLPPSGLESENSESENEKNDDNKNLNRNYLFNSNNLNKLPI
jgi:probable RNA-binding protein EIF1AD